MMKESESNRQDSHRVHVCAIYFSIYSSFMFAVENWYVDDGNNVTVYIVFRVTKSENVKLNKN